MKAYRETNHDDTTIGLTHAIAEALENADYRDSDARMHTDFEAEGGPAIMITVDGRRFEVRLMEHFQ